MSEYLIRQAQVYGEHAQDILISAGKIRRVANHIAEDEAEKPAQLTIIDAQDLIALPGMVDLHTHLREPGKETAETVLSASQAAALGGFTAIHAMANTNPVADNAVVVDFVLRMGVEAGYTQVVPVGAVTKNLAGTELAEIGSMAQSAAAVRWFSDDGMCVWDSAVMRRALEYVQAFDGVIAQHAQDPALTKGAQMHEGEVSAELGMTGWPSVAEEAIIARDILLAEYLGARLHICHVSTAGSVALIAQAKARGVKVTAEVTPHHLILTDEQVRSFNPVFKVNPPLRRQADVNAVRQGVIDGVIDVIGTDHAPHPDQDKSCEWAQAAMGMTGLESALAILHQVFIVPGLLSWRELAQITSHTPARLNSLAQQGHDFHEGDTANIILVDPAATWIFDPATGASKGNNSPFAGENFSARVKHTFFQGHQVVSDFALAGPVPAQLRTGEGA